MSQTTNEQATVARSAQGVVVSNKMDKTITVLVERRVKHPLYEKYIRKSAKYHAHDENEECNEGDTVRIVETRPLAKTKTWTLDRVITRAVE